jgi:hypothetical protein
VHVFQKHHITCDTYGLLRGTDFMNCFVQATGTLKFNFIVTKVSFRLLIFRSKTCVVFENLTELQGGKQQL